MKRFFFILALLPTMALAETSVSLPDGGEFSPGGFLRVHVTTDVPVTLEASGAIPTNVLPNGGRFDGDVPMFLFGDTPREIKWTASGQTHVLDRPLRAISNPGSNSPVGTFNEAFDLPLRSIGAEPAAENRRPILVSLAIFSIVVTAICLWRSPWRVPSVIVVVVLFTVFLAAWISRQNPLIERVGEIRVVAGTTTQRDVWTWQTSPRPIESRFVWSPMTFPMLTSPASVDDLNLRLEVNASGSSFSYGLGPGKRIAFIERYRGNNIKVTTAAKIVGANLVDFAKEIYLSPGRRIVSDGMETSIVVVEQEKAPSP